jgi:ABC-type Na+ efflux pump permease subunit
MAALIVGYAVMFTLYIAIILYAVNVLRSVVQEKTNRIVEIMVAAAKPHALMLGKILGVGAVGLVQIAIWVAMALLTMRFRGEILGVFGIAAGAWNVPALRAIDVAVVLIYFLAATSSTPRSTPRSAPWCRPSKRPSRPRPRSRCSWSSRSCACSSSPAIPAAAPPPP